MRSPADLMSARRCSGSATSPGIADAFEAGYGSFERRRSSSVDDEPPPAPYEGADESEAEAARRTGDDADGHPDQAAAPTGAPARATTLVVEAHERDHLRDVLVGLDPAGAEARRSGEDRVVVDPPLLEQGVPDVLREAEVGRVVAVQVADLPPPDPEGELAPTPGIRRDARPGGDLLGDPARSPSVCSP